MSQYSPNDTVRRGRLATTYCANMDDKLRICNMAKTYERLSEMQSLIDHCGEDWGCRDELLGGYVRADSQCEQFSVEVKNCIAQGHLKN